MLVLRDSGQTCNRLQSVLLVLIVFGLVYHTLHLGNYFLQKKVIRQYHQQETPEDIRACSTGAAPGNHLDPANHSSKMPCDKH